MEKKIPDIGLLLKSKTLSKVIMEAYERLTPCSKLDRFGVDAIVKGAKMYAYDLKMIEAEIDHYMGNSLYYEEEDIYMPFYSDLMDSYGEGFRHGYFSFEEEVVLGDIDIIDSEADKAQIIFDFVTNKPLKNAIRITNNGDWDNHSVNRIYSQGVIRGQMYRAWFVILKTQKVFEPLFKAKKPTPIDKYKPFISYLKHDNPEKLAQALKDEFAGKIGKQIAFLIYCLKESGCIINGHIVKRHLYDAIAEYFKVSIGTEAGINRFLSDKFKIHSVTLKSCEDEIEIIQDKLDEILDSI